MGTEKLSVPFNPVVFTNGNRVVLIDTGMGPAATRRIRPSATR
jgi:glyoxylase-like metal-dependent hydrolase (beta-lactamase superfamily II)